MGFEKFGQFFVDKSEKIKKNAKTAAKIGLMGVIGAMPMAAQTPSEHLNKETKKTTEQSFPPDSSLRAGTERVTKELLAKGDAAIEKERQRILAEHSNKENKESDKNVLSDAE
jgi:hypothetical protein